MVQLVIVHVEWIVEIENYWVEDLGFWVFCRFVHRRVV